MRKRSQAPKQRPEKAGASPQENGPVYDAKIPTIRAFIACDLPIEIIRAMGAFQKELQGALSKGADLQIKWVQPQSMHLTFKFMGNIDAGVTPAILDCLAEKLAPMAPFKSDVEGFGAFPSEQKPRVLWAGVEPEEAVADLTTLQQSIDAALEGIGFSREEGSFHPHITLGRTTAFGRKPELEKAFDALGSPFFGSFIVDKIVLYRSVLKPTGAEYQALGYAFLGGDDGNGKEQRKDHR